MEEIFKRVESDDTPSSLETTITLDDLRVPTDKHIPKLLKNVRDSIIGDNNTFITPYGERKITYADYVASGRLIRFFEEFLLDEVFPFYANTHTTQSVTGKVTTLLREESRNIILSSCGGSKKDDVLIFCGSGATEAINSLVKMLDLEKIEDREIVVFVAIYEHHSNILPWREMGCTVIQVPEDEQVGGLDFNFLEIELKRVDEDWKKQDKPRPYLIGSFSAASNITGMMTDVLRATQILHKYKGLAFFDFACAAPYSKIDMNQTIDEDGEVVKIDAIFFSTHKFLGGPGGPGVLIVKKKLCGSGVVVRPGGGTVFFVTEHDHIYLKNNVMKQEGGTPNIIGCIRAGMSCYLKEQIGVEFIERKEEDIDKYIQKRTAKMKNLVVVGNTRAKKLPIVSFLIKTPLGMYLHGNFVSALLNDLFGIQTRAGCMCAGPYGESLLGLDYEKSKNIEKILLQNEEAYGFLRPGFTRLNLHYVMDQSTIDFVLDCVEFVSEHGWKFLIDYNYHPKSGSWRHYQEKPLANRRWIHDIYFQNGEFEFRGEFKNKVNLLKMKNELEEEESEEGMDWSGLFQGYIDFAKDYVGKRFTREMQANHSLQRPLLTEDINKYRWFILPSEAYCFQKGQPILDFPEKCIVQPKVYPHELLEEEEEEEVSKDSKEEEREGESDSDDDDDDVENPLLQIDLYDDDDISEEEKAKQARKYLWKVGPPGLTKTTIEAIEHFGMINEGDRLLLGLSGGKDSLTLLHVLHEIQRKSKIKFELGCCTIDPQASGYDPSVLKPYMKQLGVEYHYVQQNVIEIAKNVNKDSICSFCSRMRRGLLYSTCRKNNYNVLVLAQHLDDLIESFLMSVFHNGVMRTMKAHYTIDEGDLRVIRPLVFSRERWLRSFAIQNKLPIIFENCPACFEVPKERKRIKKLLKSQEAMFPHLYKSFRGALTPLMQMGEIYDEDNFAKKFKTRKMKMDEKVSAITGLTRGVARQRKVICTAPLQFLLDEVERRSKNKKKKEDKKNKKRERSDVEEEKEKGEGTSKELLVWIVLGFVISFLVGALFS